MIRRLLAAAVAVPLAAPAAVGEAPPYQLVRSLQLYQEDLARGAAGDTALQGPMIARLSQALLRAAPDAFAAPVNARAGLVAVLSSADAAVLDRLAATAALPADALAAARALAEGDGAAARRLIDGLDLLALDRVVAAHLAIAGAALWAADDPARALRLLDTARLLVPGTMLEEAALRRQVTVAAAAGDLDKTEALIRRYVEHYAGSAFADAMVAQIAAAVAALRYEAMPERLDGLLGLVERAPEALRGRLYLGLARHAMAAGQARLAGIAARRAAASESGAQASAELLRAASEVVGADPAEARARLERIDAGALPERDRALLAAARELAGHITAWPDPPSAPPVPAPDAIPAAERAAQALAAARAAAAKALP